MNAIILLAAILFGLMVWVGGKKGVRSFISLFFNFIVFLIALMFIMAPSVNPIAVTLLACTAISSINLFFINRVNSKTIMAFASTIITICLLLFLIDWIANQSKIQGFGEEEIGEISMFSLHIGIDFVQIAVSMIIISTIGAITDVAIAISSPMRELIIHDPDISREDLFRSGMTIGRDILGSDTNTLFFAFIGGYMALILWFRDLNYSVGQMVNAKVFGGEMLTIFCAGIGIALVIPVSAGINAWYLTRRRERKQTG